MQCFLVRGSNEKQRRGRINSNFTKGDFFISYINQVLLGIISQCGLSFCTLSIKVFLSLSVWARREYIWKLNWKESLLICFENCQGVPCSHKQNKNSMVNTFITVNIALTCKRCLEDKSMLFHFKKAFPLTLLEHSFERRACCLLPCFQRYQGISYSHTGQVVRRWLNLC